MMILRGVFSWTHSWKSPKISSSDIFINYLNKSIYYLVSTCLKNIYYPANYLHTYFKIWTNIFFTFIKNTSHKDFHVCFSHVFLSGSIVPHGLLCSICLPCWRLRQVPGTIPLKLEQRRHLSLSFLIEAKQGERKFQALGLGWEVGV